MLIVRGEVDVATAAQLRHELLQHLAIAETLWIDLEDVTFMDSSGLHVLIASQRRAELLDAPLVIGRASTAVERLLEVTGVTALFARGVEDRLASVATPTGPGRLLRRAGRLGHS
jgi:anti-anti-sigma factor